MSTESVIPSTIFTLLPASPLALSLSQHQALGVRWPKFWSFSISLSNEYSGFISFRIDSFDLFAVQETLKNLLQHHSSKASILPSSAFYMVQLSHPYMTTRKTIALTVWTFVSKVISLPFNMLSRFVIAFLPVFLGFPGGLVSKESAHNAGDLGSIPGLGRSPGGGHGNPLQYSCLESPMDRGVWQAIVHGVYKESIPRSKCLLISWLQSSSADKNKIL